MGLDIVRQTVESIQGLISVENRPGLGVCFSLDLPVTIATTLCLLVRANHQIFALPTRHVTRLTYLQAEHLQWKSGHFLLMHPTTEPIPAVSLSHLLGPASPAPESSMTETHRIAVLLGSAERQIALLVDELFEVQDIVIKKLPPPFTHVPNISGACILGTGAVILALNVIDLLKFVRRFPKRR
jgi:two-component system chemotaxis sensor kinase CheA